MEWAKTRSVAAFNLSTSGVRSLDLDAFPVPVRELSLEVAQSGSYGYAPLKRAIADRYGVPESSVVTALGASMANHLAMAALLDPGDEVVIENPTYGLLVDVAEYLGASVVRFERPSPRFQVLPEEIERAVSDRTRLIVLSNLHNPSGAYTEDDVLAEIGRIARRVGAMVLVVETYLDALFAAEPRTAARLGEEFVTTRSLTKLYGLGGLRCGWILAAPALAEAIWRLDDLFDVVPPLIAQLLSVAAFEHLDTLAASTQRLLARNTEILDAFMQSRDDLEVTPIVRGTICFPRLRRADPDALFPLLRNKYDTTVAPGHFFGLPDHMRVGIGGDTEELREGLSRLGRALDELAN